MQLKNTHTHSHTHTHTTEMGQRSKWIFSQRMYPDLYKVHEKMLSIPNDWRNANQNYNEVSAKNHWEWLSSKRSTKIKLCQEQGEKESFYPGGRDVNGWVRPRRKKAWRFLKTLNMELLMPWKPTPCLRSRKTKQFKWYVRVPLFLGQHYWLYWRQSVQQNVHRYRNEGNWSI